MPLYKLGNALVRATAGIMLPSLANAGIILYFPLHLSADVDKYF